MRKELLKERDRLMKVKKRISDKGFDDIEALELLLDTEETLCTYTIFDFVENRYKYVLDILKACKIFKIDTKKLEKAYIKAIEKYDECTTNGEPIMKEIKNNVIVFGRNAKEDGEIIESYENMISELLNLVITEETQREIKKYMDELDDYLRFKIELIDNQIRNIDMQLEKYEDEYLEKMTQIAFERIRKKCKIDKNTMRYLLGDMIIDWDRYKTLDHRTGGIYNIITKEITINTNYLFNNKLTHKNNTENQKKINEKLLSALIHELTHHIVKTLYSKQLTPYDDYSPIFMSMLLWINPNEENSYDCFKDFKETETYKKAMECESFRELQTFCRRLQRDVYNVMCETRPKEDCFWIQPDKDFYKAMDFRNSIYGDIDINLYCAGIDYLDFIQKYGKNDEIEKYY